jgi:hypothetical protein
MKKEEATRAMHRFSSLSKVTPSQSFKAKSPVAGKYTLNLRQTPRRSLDRMSDNLPEQTSESKDNQHKAN